MTSSIDSLTFHGRLAIQQRVLPAYRAPFFDALATVCKGGMSLFAGEVRLQEAIKTTTELQIAHFAPAHNRHILGGPFYICRQDGFIEWLEDQQPDALIVEANPRYINTPKGISWMQQHGRPVLGWGLGAPPITGRLRGIRDRARKRLLFSLDGIISYSQRGAKEYRTLGLPPDRIFVAYNAASPRPTKPPPKRPPDFQGPPTVLFVGRLQARKQLGNLFKACTAQPPERKPRVLIIGDGPDRKMFERQAQDHFPQAEFLGAKHGAELEEFFALADLFVLPGTGGLAVQQAMSHGLPVIVAQGDGTQEDLARPENGWLIPPNDLEALTNTLGEALSDSVRLRRMGAESYRITAEEINLDEMVAAFVKSLNQVSKSP
ncbi:MAG: glycosyltransferase [Anaerolineales bacterium]|nr:MAG: glycosyltransferase [Anaerolineales bacterium]